LLILCCAHVHAMKQELAAQKWVAFVKTPAYPAQLEQLHNQAEITTKKLYSKKVEAGYIHFRNIQYTCHKTYYDQDLLHPKNCSTCDNAFFKENRKTQNYIIEKDKENRIGNALTDVLDHFQGIGY